MKILCKLGRKTKLYLIFRNYTLTASLDKIFHTHMLILSFNYIFTDTKS